MKGYIDRRNWLLAAKEVDHLLFQRMLGVRGARDWLHVIALGALEDKEENEIAIPSRCIVFDRRVSDFTVKRRFLSRIAAKRLLYLAAALVLAHLVSVHFDEVYSILEPIFQTVLEAFK